MKKVTGKAVLRIFQRTIHLLEPRLVNHGGRVAYILRCMLECDGRYRKAQLDRFLVLGMLHDIGACKTDEIDQMLTFDCRRVWKHSVYGYLFLRYLSPLREDATSLLYHHLDYNRFDRIDCPNKEIAMYLNIADRADILLCHRLKKLDAGELEAGRGARFSGAGLDLFYRADKQFAMVEQLGGIGYQKQLDAWFEEVDFGEEECKEYLKLLNYIIDFKSEKTVLRTVTTSVVGLYIADLLAFTQQERDLFYYALLVYDLGMLGIPDSITNAPRALSETERRRMQTHVRLMAEVMGDDLDEGVVRVAMGHHEKLDGSGYPNRLQDAQIDKLQRALAVADILSALSCGNRRRMAYKREDIVRTMTEEATTGKLDIKIVSLVVENLDTIMKHAVPYRDQLLTNYRAIKEQSDLILMKFDSFD